MHFDTEFLKLCWNRILTELLFSRALRIVSHVDTSGFDFSDDSSSVRLQPRRTPGSAALKGSAKKKTTIFENILASVRRQQKIEAREKTSRYKKWISSTN